MKLETKEKSKSKPKSKIDLAETDSFTRVYFRNGCCVSEQISTADPAHATAPCTTPLFRQVTFSVTHSPGNPNCH